MSQFRSTVVLLSVCARLPVDDPGWIDLTVACNDGRTRILRVPKYCRPLDVTFRANKRRKFHVWGQSLANTDETLYQLQGCDPLHAPKMRLLKRKKTI